MDNWITLPPMMAENEDSFMRTFAKNYARIKDPRAKLKFYTGAMENMKARGMKPKDFLEAFKRHAEGRAEEGAHVWGLPKKLFPSPVTKWGAVRG